MSKPVTKQTIHLLEFLFLHTCGFKLEAYILPMRGCRALNFSGVATLFQGIPSVCLFISTSKGIRYS